MKIKEKPEHFIVEEKTAIVPKKSGDYIYFWLTKKNYNTIDALRKISNKLHIAPKKLGFAGTKDKHAITTQLCSAYRVTQKNIERLVLKDIEIKYFGYGDKPISLGDLKKNRFEIIATLEKNEHAEFIENVNRKVDFTINYFDEQRFSKSNAQVGRAIVKKDFKKAVELLITHDRKYGSNLQNKIEKQKNDFVGALRLIPKKILLLLVHSYQSYIWNEAVRRYIESCNIKTKKIEYSLGTFLFPKSSMKNKKVKLVGFATEFKKTKVDKIIKEILSEEKIGPRDFIIREIPEISLEGEKRDIITKIEEFSHEKVDNKKVKMCFTLQKGSYATIVAKTLCAVN